MTSASLRVFFPQSPRDAECHVYVQGETLKCEAKGQARNVVYMKLREEAAAFETDPGFPPDGRHCDWAVFTTAKDKSTFIEFKGRHVVDSVGQLVSTIRYVLSRLEGFPAPRVAYCVTTGGGHPRIPRTGNASFSMTLNKSIPRCIFKTVRTGSTVTFF